MGDTFYGSEGVVLKIKYGLTMLVKYYNGKKILQTTQLYGLITYTYEHMNKVTNTERKHVQSSKVPFYN